MADEQSRQHISQITDWQMNKVGRSQKKMAKEYDMTGRHLSSDDSFQYFKG